MYIYIFIWFTIIRQKTYTSFCICPASSCTAHNCLKKSLMSDAVEAFWRLAGRLYTTPEPQSSEAVCCCQRCRRGHANSNQLCVSKKGEYKVRSVTYAKVNLASLHTHHNLGSHSKPSGSYQALITHLSAQAPISPDDLGVSPSHYLLSALINLTLIWSNTQLMGRCGGRAKRFGLINVSYALLMPARPVKFNTDARITNVVNFHCAMNDSDQLLCRCLLSRCGAQGGGRGWCRQDRGKISALSSLCSQADVTLMRSFTLARAVAAFFGGELPFLSHTPWILCSPAWYMVAVQLE